MCECAFSVWAQASGAWCGWFVTSISCLSRGRLGGRQADSRSPYKNTGRGQSFFQSSACCHAQRTAAAAAAAVTAAVTVVAVVVVTVVVIVVDVVVVVVVVASSNFV